MVARARPFVAVAKEGRIGHDLGQVARILPQRGGIEKVERRPRCDHAQLVPRRFELPREGRNPDGGDRTGHAENEPSHGWAYRDKALAAGPSDVSAARQ